MATWRCIADPAVGCGAELRADAAECTAGACRDALPGSVARAQHAGWAVADWRLTGVQGPGKKLHVRDRALHRITAERPKVFRLCSLNWQIIVRWG